MNISDFQDILLREKYKIMYRKLLGCVRELNRISRQKSININCIFIEYQQTESDIKKK